jgi:glycosyltransferase involved in cell wall biosynthesis
MARELGPGGSERQLTEIAKGLDRRRFLPYVGYFRGGMRLEELQDAQVPTLHIDIASFKRKDVLTKAHSFGKFVKDRRIGIVHTFDYPLTSFAVPFARWFGVPIVLSSQRGHRDLIPSFYRTIVQSTDLLVDGIVVNCCAVQEDLIREEDVPRSKVRLCYNGIDWEKFQLASPCAIRHNLPQNSLVVGCVSVLRQEKHLDLLLAAVASLVPSLPELQLMLVGNGPEEDFLRERARELGILHRCLFHPAEKDVGPWLKSIDIFVLPSLTEALSNSLMEAMASGCSIIASNVGGNPELVSHGETGMLFKSNDAQSLAATIRLVARNPNLRRRLACNAQALIRENFRLEQSAGRMAEIYDDFVSRKAICRNQIT